MLLSRPIPPSPRKRKPTRPRFRAADGFFEPAIELPPPATALQFCVVVPVKNEERLLPRLIAALEAQSDGGGRPIAQEGLEVILLLNNCTDGTAQVVARLQKSFPRLVLHSVSLTLAPAEAHVGRARQLLFNVAAARFATLSRPAGLILTTDADTSPAPDWVAQTQREIGRGVDAVGGRIFLHEADLAGLPAPVRRCYLNDLAYRRALEEMRHLYAPDAHDPFPRHHQHFAASLAVTAGAYRECGGMPLVRSSEDVALYHALLARGKRFRHSYRVQVATSARLVGRAVHGLSDALSWWDRQCQERKVFSVETAEAAERRFALLGLWRQEWPGQPAPSLLYHPPEPPSPDHKAPLEITLNRLRHRNGALRALPLPERLARARQLLELA